MNNSRQTELSAGANQANYRPLTPLNFIERAARIHPDAPAIAYGAIRRNWAETFARIKKLAVALEKRGYAEGDVVSMMSANIPELLEAHFAVPMFGGILNAINTTLDAKSVAWILNHSKAKVLIVDPAFSAICGEALGLLESDEILIVDVLDDSIAPVEPIGSTTFEALLSEAEPEEVSFTLGDELTPLSLNYTSGTTGHPKGVLYSHRGANLNAAAHVADWPIPFQSIYLWTLPMFHCNGWCFPWAIAAAAGLHVCTRTSDPDEILRLIKYENVTHSCGSPSLLNSLANSTERLSQMGQPVEVMTAGAPPPSAVIKRIEAMGIVVTHVYGLTEVYGPALINVWKSEWDHLSEDDRAKLKARQGIGNSAVDDMMVATPDDMKPVLADGSTVGEIFIRGNNVMLGYLENDEATRKSFKRAWFATGDLAVMHLDGYVEVKDRATDVITCNGKFVSSVEIEEVLYHHTAVLEAAVVAKPDNKWGEVPCAFVKLHEDEQVSESDLSAYCASELFQIPAAVEVVFSDLPKTPTGKVQKFSLRNKASQI